MKNSPTKQPKKDDRKEEVLWALLGEGDYIAMTQSGQLFLYFDRKMAARDAKRFGLRVGKTAIGYSLNNKAKHGAKATGDNSL